MPLSAIFFFCYLFSGGVVVSASGRWFKSSQPRFEGPWDGEVILRTHSRLQSRLALLAAGRLGTRRLRGPSGSGDENA